MADDIEVVLTNLNRIARNELPPIITNTSTASQEIKSGLEGIEPAFDGDVFGPTLEAFQSTVTSVCAELDKANERVKDTVHAVIEVLGAYRAVDGANARSITATTSPVGE
ncbi:hypothetical protein [Stackebrandtia nassauensis]|uniref:PE domain-containing protein n=1 Tax=Stackebrandtia nassauensis (strain DSM 44728 / CIP 108903 / NRRL B-16338 / NBRC 102104 / LLR-40K-21) TaxID=446470 RepID=D3Q0C7_STANL|nr:hypothetical protein [Stackebrandtia nassauensis]ADD39791.1 hypothetical protein Snas_0069 [Stackebrandtia nassauensis DSM 44728]